MNKNSMLLSYEQLYTETFQQYKPLISEKSAREYNPLFQLIQDVSHTSRHKRKTGQ